MVMGLLGLSSIASIVQDDRHLKVLITGMSGLIGGAVRERLADRYELSALNRSAVPGVPTFQADIADFPAIQPAFVGQDVVVHLAGYMEGDHWDGLLQTNVIGTYNVFEASRLAGVKRVIFGSSGATIAGWEKEEPYLSVMEGRYNDAPSEFPRITRDTPVRPSGIYGCTKVWGEALARHFADTSDLSILCVRIAAVTKEDRPTAPRMVPRWCSLRDVAQMIERCITAPPELKFDIFYVVSNNRWGWRDISHAREVLGYEPQDSADEEPIS